MTSNIFKMFVVSLLSFMFMPIVALPKVNDFSTSGTTTGKECFDVTIPVNFTGSNSVWGMPQFENDLDVVAFIAAFNNRTLGTNESSSTFVPVAGTKIETFTFDIAGTYCKPVSGPGDTLLLASHGITLNRFYWDSGYQPTNYSFVDYVVDKGYAVFYYDRLGAGDSSKPSGYVNSGTIQVSILEQLINHIRAGKLSTSYATVPDPKKLILVGHSYGSVLTNALVSTQPDIADGIILTGWSLAFSPATILSTAQVRIANQARPAQFSEYDTGSLCFVDFFASVQLFYQQGAFDVDAARWPYAIESPVNIMEFMSLAALNLESPSVTAPVLFLSGEYDNAICQGYCPGGMAGAVGMFPNSENLEVYFQPGTGHNLNFHYNATGSYDVITNFLEKNGF